GAAVAIALTAYRTYAIQKNVKKKHTDRRVFQCFVFGPKNAGKSALLSSFVGRPFLNNYDITSNHCYTVNSVEQHGGMKKTLILHEIQEDNVKEFLSSKDSLAVCDVAVFVYDSLDEYSLIRASELLMDVAREGEESGYGVPCLLICAKSDLQSYPMEIKETKMISQTMKIGAPLHISIKENKMNSVFRKIVNAAEQCHLNIPETEQGRNKKHYQRLVNRSLIVASVGAAVAIALTAYRTYAIQKNYELNLSMYEKAAKLEKQMDAKLAWLLEKYYYRSQESVGCSSLQADLYLTEKELHQLHLDEEALRETLEEKAREEKIRQNKLMMMNSLWNFGCLKMKHNRHELKVHSNADLTRTISKSIFVTNFPDNTTSADLWKICQTYGVVVDVYILNRRSKVGKRFAFVRFIKVTNVERLVGNLCTLWIGRMHLYANVVRFERTPFQQSQPPPPTRPGEGFSIQKVVYLGGLSVVEDLNEPHGWEMED
nr:mitochondrial Rho GTPase [Tanacetum cinerariifolium]